MAAQMLYRVSCSVAKFLSHSRLTRSHARRARARENTPHARARDHFISLETSSRVKHHDDACCEKTANYKAVPLSINQMLYKVLLRIVKKDKGCTLPCTVPKYKTVHLDESIAVLKARTSGQCRAAVRLVISESEKARPGLRARV